jgi:hypothetical protein
MTTNTVKAICQLCSGHIEFDAGDIAEGETRTIECPHCHMETLVLVRRPTNPPASQPKASVGFRDWIRAVPKPAWLAFTSTTRFERIVFSLIRGFALFWAALMVLALLLVTFNYLRGFPTSASSDTDSSFASHLVESKAWQNFALYMAAVFVLLFMLTIISIVLLLLAIERNSRKEKQDVA